MNIECLVGEIGSTTTLVHAFDFLEGSLIWLAKGVSETSVEQGDVSIGLKSAIENLKKELNVNELHWQRFMVASSAAGGLKMTVHGLVWDMTVKAAKEAALGAGANIQYITAGLLSEDDLKEIEKIRPNIILLAGGVDYGEKNTILANARMLCNLSIKVPIIYAGNKEIQGQILAVFQTVGRECRICDNVYPSIDQLHVEPLRKLIQQVFEKHITEAVGMSKIRELVSGSIVPVPAAVNTAAQIYYQIKGPCMVIDVGGATSDVHSVTDDSERYRNVLTSPEPFAKRTVEGDMGVYKNRLIVAQHMKEPPIKDWHKLLDDLQPIEEVPVRRDLVDSLTQAATHVALSRHVGKIHYMYLQSGRKTMASGKDCTDVKTILLTGGALIYHSDAIAMVTKTLLSMDPTLLLPNVFSIIVDKQYLLSAIGVLSIEYPNEAKQLIIDLIARNQL
ncbi:MAG: glutamate mutase L [Erysipelotrichaceae bacterium]|nr:glutamate mutase L [Erysipelotrichaceae bacterium]